MPALKQGRMLIDDWRKERVYIDLTSKQKMLVETFVASEDRVLSVMTAYQVKNPSVARVQAYECFANPRIISCLAAYYQDDPLESFKREVARAFRNKKFSVAQLGAMRLYADLHNWSKESLPRLNGYTPVGDRETFKVGDSCEQNGVRYRVTKVDANGNILEAV